ARRTGRGALGAAKGDDEAEVRVRPARRGEVDEAVRTDVDGPAVDLRGDQPAAGHPRRAGPVAARIDGDPGDVTAADTHHLAAPRPGDHDRAGIRPAGDRPALGRATGAHGGVDRDAGVVPAG